MFLTVINEDVVNMHDLTSHFKLFKLTFTEG